MASTATLCHIIQFNSTKSKRLRDTSRAVKSSCGNHPQQDSFAFEMLISKYLCDIQFANNYPDILMGPNLTICKYLWLLIYQLCLSASKCTTFQYVARREVFIFNYYYFLATPGGMQDLHSLDQGSNLCPCIGSRVLNTLVWPQKPQEDVSDLTAKNSYLLLDTSLGQ